MNNYCTNCGKKLVKNEMQCEKCNTLIVDLPCDFYYVTPRKKERNKKILIGLIIIAGAVLITILVQYIMFKIKIEKYEKEYILLYLEEKYEKKSYEIEFSERTKCIISGDCYYDPAMGCDGGVCEPYQYVEEGCYSYHYVVKTKDEELMVNVSQIGDNLKVGEGKHTYQEKYIVGEPYESYYIPLEFLNAYLDYNIYSDDEDDYITIKKLKDEDKMSIIIYNITHTLDLEEISIVLYDKNYKQISNNNTYIVDGSTLIFEIFNENNELKKAKFFKLLFKTSKENNNYNDNNDYNYYDDENNIYIEYDSDKNEGVKYE